MKSAIRKFFFFCLFKKEKGKFDSKEFSLLRKKVDNEKFFTDRGKLFSFYFMI